MSVAAPPGYVCQPFGTQTTRGYIRRRVYRRTAAGPTVILMHEAPGISPSTFRIAEFLHAAGYAVALPELMRPGPFGPEKVRNATGMLRFCVARELAAFSSNRTGSIVEWLRDLAGAESAADKGRNVAVIGMCFSGGFALGALLEDAVSAAVSSQPALPFPIWFGRAVDIGLSRDDVGGIQGRVVAGAGLRVMRYAKDYKSPGRRFQRIVDDFPTCSSQQIPTSRRNDHSVLRDSIDAPPGTDLRDARDLTLAFLRQHLPL
ncbi:MAG: putative dienelactone hydrolase [Chloroflexota bacterium]|nr:putative dienelactone hydrolase [Chloroflexota bacterium]